jgi:FkbM family methyltransferase
MLPFVQKITDGVAWRSWYYQGPVGTGVLKRFLFYPRVFQTWEDGLAYARLLVSCQHPANPVLLRVRQVMGHSLLCRPGTSDPWVLWDTFFHQFQKLPKGITPKDCIVDLGANVGYTAAFFAANYPSVRVLAVEMDRQNSDIANLNLKGFGSRCLVVNAAVWSQDGEIEYSGIEEQGYRVSSLLGHNDVDEGQKVTARSLESLFDEHGVNSVDYLKMDIEGAEAAVLSGSLAWARRVQVMKIELHKPATYEQCEAILEGIGFNCYRDNSHPNCLVARR